MEPTFKAILARFDGDAEKAFHYCRVMAETYGELAPEYAALAFRFGWSNPSVTTEVYEPAKAAAGK